MLFIRLSLSLREEQLVRCFELSQTLMLQLFIWKLLFLTLKSSKQNFILSIYFQTVTDPLESSSANISTSTLDRRGSRNVGKSFNNSVFWITMVFGRQLMEIYEKKEFEKIFSKFLFKINIFYRFIKFVFLFS